MRVANRTDTISTLGADVTSAAFSLEHMTGYSLILTATETSATLAGTVKLQMSNNAFKEDSGAEDPSATWVDITGATDDISGTSEVAFNVDGSHYRAVRYVYTSSSGNGTAQAFWHATGPQS